MNSVPIVGKTHLGRARLVVSRLALGTANFGTSTSEADALTILDHALEHGIHFIDTADQYGREAGRGTTEKIIGRWFASRTGNREKVVLATKVYGSMGDCPTDSRLSARHIRQACDESLTRLQTDFIDLYQMHHIDRNTPFDEIWQAMEQLIRAGKVIYVGSSNFAAWHIMKANDAARHRNLLGIVSEQSVYHLNNRMVELEVLPMCESEGVGFLAWSPLGGGLLAGPLNNTAGPGRRAVGSVRSAIERFHDRLQRYETLCKGAGAAPAEVGLAWILRNPAVTAPVIGPRTMEQLESAIRAVCLELSNETLQELDAIFPGPAGQAPEAYAW